MTNIDEQHFLTSGVQLCFAVRSLYSENSFCFAVVMASYRNLVTPITS